MRAETLVGQDTAVTGKLRLFSMYVDFAASAHARWATSAITRLAGSRWQSSHEMWNLDALAASGSVRTMIARDAADADVLIVAATSLDQREPKLIEWLDSLAAWKDNRPVAGMLVGMFGDEENRAKELEWTVQQFIYCARQMDRDLVVQWMERDSLDYSDWLTVKVGALLARKQVAHGGAMRPELAVGAGEI